MDGQSTDTYIGAGSGNAAIRKRIGHFTAPPCLIPPGSNLISPHMVPLAALDQPQLDRVIQTVPGGAQNIKDIYPLTPMQEGILFHHALAQRADIYLTPTLLEFESRARFDAFRSALQAVIDRHDILRTAVVWEQLPRPVQVVYRRAELPVNELPLEEDPVAYFKEHMRPGLEKLNIQQAPMIRLQAASNLGDGRWYAVLQIHHLVCDGISLEIVIREVLAFPQGKPGTECAEFPYRNYVAWTVSDGARRDAEKFFRERLGSCNEPTAPFGLLDVRGESVAAEEFKQTLEPDLARRLRARARAHRVSVATLFHAAWGLVVAITSGREDIVFGTVLFGRLRVQRGSPRAVGMFLNTLPLRLQLQGVTASQLVTDTHAGLLELLKHEQASLAVAQRCSGIPGAAPLFTTLLNYRYRTMLPGDEWTNKESGLRVLASNAWTNYPIAFAVDDLGVDFVLTAQADQRIGTHRVMAYMSTAIQSLTEALEESPQKAALALPILPEWERRQVIEAFNSTRVPYPNRKLINELFEEQVCRTPDAIAIRCEQALITYGDLNCRANQLARYLVNSGVGRGDLLAICLERGLEMVITALAVLKAGAAYVPLDPNSPPQRLRYMLADSKARLVCTSEELVSALASAMPSVVVGQVLRESGGWDDRNLDARKLGLTSGDLAYVIYTSGSTGEPKGVMVTHCNLVASTTARWSLYGKPDCFLMVSPLSFDSSVAGIFGTLTQGGVLLIGTQEAIRDPDLLKETIGTFNVTDLLCVPALYQRLLCVNDAETWVRSLSRVIVAGEACPPSLVSESVRRLPDVRLFNEYGPTEVTVWATVFECMSSERVDRIPIGRPIANTQIYILDRSGQPVPIGLAGEIYIGGAGVARGYLRRPALTLERFLPDPFSQDPKARLYRTGDLGRWRSDGNIEYLGRNDEQVKIRGHRIEVGEIEASLLQCQKVAEAVVIAREDVSGDQQLVAYIRWSGERDSVATELRAHLQTILPEYMIPTAFVLLDKMPRTPHGKLDRRALSGLNAKIYSRRGYEAPEGEVEQTLAAIWEELLGVQSVGRDDNFFELGGHSLTGMKLITIVSERFAIRQPVATVFRYPTIRQLAEFVEALLVSDQRQLVSSESELDEGTI